MSGNYQQAEDLFQETFRRVHAKADTFNPQNSFKNWLYTIATNIAIDGFRRTRRQPVTVSLSASYVDNSPDRSPALRDNLTGSDPSPLDTALSVERRQHVQSAIARLPDRQRAALVLIYYQGLSYSEAAAALGCSLGTVKTQMFRALRKLAQLLPDIQGDKL